jgi:hypothetical protein
MVIVFREHVFCVCGARRSGCVRIHLSRNENILGWTRMCSHFGWDRSLNTFPLGPAGDSGEEKRVCWFLRTNTYLYTEDLNPYLAASTPLVWLATDTEALGRRTQEYRFPAFLYLLGTSVWCVDQKMALGNNQACHWLSLKLWVNYLTTLSVFHI